MENNQQPQNIENATELTLKIDQSFSIINGDELTYKGLNKWGEVIFMTPDKKEIWLKPGYEYSKEVIKGDQVHHVKYGLLKELDTATETVKFIMYREPVHTPQYTIEPLEL